MRTNTDYGMLYAARIQRKVAWIYLRYFKPTKIKIVYHSSKKNIQTRPGHYLNNYRQNQVYEW